MKKMLILLLSAAALTACDSTKKDKGDSAASAGNPGKIKFETDAFDFGKINQGDKVTHEFKFTNTGSSPLVITNSTATCGCTTPEWPRTPVQPGAAGIIKVTFDSAGKTGLQDKQITVVANTRPANTVVHLVGEVIEKK